MHISLGGLFDICENGGGGGGGALRPFSRALTVPIFSPIPNAKLKFFFPIEKINSQLKKLNIFLLKSIKSILNIESCKTCPSSLKYEVYTSN